MTTTKREYLTVGEVANVLRVSAGTIIRWVDAHQIPGFRIGSVIRVPREAFERWRVETDGNGNEPPGSTSAQLPLKMPGGSPPAPARADVGRGALIFGARRGIATEGTLLVLRAAEAVLKRAKRGETITTANIRAEMSREGVKAEEVPHGRHFASALQHLKGRGLLEPTGSLQYDSRYGTLRAWRVTKTGPAAPEKT